MASEKRKVSPDQVQELFQFCEKKRVRFYELQLELVDHLATDIESQWHEYPERTFSTALDKAYGRFGIFGFAKLEQKFHTNTSKRVMKKAAIVLWEGIKSGKLPLYFMLTVLLNVCLHQIGGVSWLYLPYVNFVIWCLLGIVLGREFVRNSKNFRKFSSYVHASALVMFPLWVMFYLSLNFLNLWDRQVLDGADGIYINILLGLSTVEVVFGYDYLKSIRKELWTKYGDYLILSKS